MATNHFGPFLLTGLLLPQLVARRRRSRRHGVQPDAPGRQAGAAAGPASKPRRYSRWAVYGQTKLANLLFTYELERRLVAAGLPVRALAAHPGLRRHPPRRQRPVRPPVGRAAPRSWTPASRRSRSQPPRALGRPDGGHRGPARRHVRRPVRAARGSRWPAVVTSTALARDPDARPALGAQRGDDGNPLPLTKVGGAATLGRCATAAPGPSVRLGQAPRDVLTLNGHAHWSSSRPKPPGALVRRRRAGPEGDGGQARLAEDRRPRRSRAHPRRYAAIQPSASPPPSKPKGGNELEDDDQQAPGPP